MLTGGSHGMLELRGVGHRFAAGPWLFRNLTAHLRPGRLYALTGPSGSGKSTLLSIIAGWVAPTEGWIERPAGLRIGWVFQNPHGVARRRAIDHVLLPLTAGGADLPTARLAAAVLLDRFGIAHVADRPFHELSGGEAQRLMLARGVAARPGLQLIDEPTAQLDRTSADAVNAAIVGLAQQDAIVIVATHDPGTRAACTDELDLSAFALRPEGQPRRG